jgi:hypothetical protein
MDPLISSIANSGNLAVIVLVLSNAGLLWLLRYLLTTIKELQAERATADKANSEADMKIAEALVMLRMELTRGQR